LRDLLSVSTSASDLHGLKSNSHRHAKHVRFGGVNWIPDNSRLSPTENLNSGHDSSNCSIHTSIPDKARLPPTRSDVARHEHANSLWTAVLHMTKPKRHATRVIYRLTVQTLPDCLETQFTSPDPTQTALSCRVWWAV